jgi:hypothetical protein
MNEGKAKTRRERALDFDREKMSAWRQDAGWHGRALETGWSVNYVCQLASVAPKLPRVAD